MDQTDAVVVGAGPAGLAMGAVLREIKVPFVMLERDEQVGSAWRRHYERLHLHTVKQHSSLPYRPFPKDVPRYPSCDQVIRYLEDYSRHFDLAPHYSWDVTHIRRAADGWVTGSLRGTVASRQVVVAAGYNRIPRMPSWPGQHEFGGQILHSSGYRNGAPWKGRHVLVVGAGNSGAEIALDLCDHGADVSLCVRGGLNVVPRDFLGIPIQVSTIRLAALAPGARDTIGRAISRLAFGDLRRYGIHMPERGPVTDLLQRGRVPLIDVGTIDRIKRGLIQVVPAIERFTGTEVVFVDGRHLPLDLVLLATGYTTGLGELLQEPGLLDARGYPLRCGEETAPGLYFLGYRNTPTGLLRSIAQDALAIGEHIGRRHATSSPRRLPC